MIKKISALFIVSFLLFNNCCFGMKRPLINIVKKSLTPKSFNIGTPTQNLRRFPTQTNALQVSRASSSSSDNFSGRSFPALAMLLLVLNQEDEQNKISRQKHNKNISIFFEALTSNDLDLMETLLLTYNVNDITNHEGLLPIHVAAHSKKVTFETMQWLVQQGANLNAQTKDGFTPLHILASHQNERSGDEVADAIKIDLLLRSGANTTIKNNQGDTLLHTAARFKNIQATFLFRSLALFATNNEGEIPYNLAQKAGWGKKFKKLIESISEK